MAEKKLVQQVQFDPKEVLFFEGKVEETRKQQVTIINSTYKIVAFKCKGTSPDQIKIRPGYGFIKPSENAVITVNVLLWKERARPPTNERLVILVAIVSEPLPKTPIQMWRGALTPKDPRRHIVQLRFPEVKTNKAQPESAYIGQQNVNTEKTAQ